MSELDAAYENMLTAIEMYEGVVWRSGEPTAGWALQLVSQAKDRLEKSRDRLQLGPSLSRRDPTPKPDPG